ncbi:amino acid ABC transporter permease [Trinickia dinghuensis]|uniref:Amino acid ABC transporter permease n=1 Tax=Trinickia dinghuensis TaxID=2291023 RepID=A0A3D8JWL7_9BURK|nr:amino acid ABC transporter permease [Trinickia dinghuensis]RDU97260.1 amino acid ABC transporter permease [Trinickia dinghuensis]
MNTRHFISLLPRFLLRAAAALALAHPVGASAQTSAGVADGTRWTVLIPWLPVLLKGFAFDVLISFIAMAIGTVLGMAAGIGQISPHKGVRVTSRWITQFLRNAPWLVILFFCIYLMPYQIDVLGLSIPFPAWVKGIVGLSFPVMGNVSEVVRGGIQSLPTAQWEAAAALGLTRRQTLKLCILPQAVKRMAAPWMNTYAILMMSTPLVSIVGVDDSVSIASSVLSALANPALMMPVYGLILILFFAYCAPIAMLTKQLERRYR